MLHRCLTQRQYPMSITTLLTSFITLLPLSVHAEAIGAADAQISEAGQFDVPTLDLSVRAAPDASRGSMRITLPRMSEHYVLFFDLQTVSANRDDLAINGEVDYSGLSSGFGLFYTGLPDWKSLSSTLRLSMHREKSEADTLLSVSGREGTLKNEFNSTAISLLLSPRKPLHGNGLNGYLSVGLSHDRQERLLQLDGVTDSRLSERDSTINGTLEAGLAYPRGRLRLHAVATYHEELSLAIGLRYHLKGGAGTP